MSGALAESIYRSQPEEHAFRLTSVEGQIPPELSGTFLRSGPGLLEAGKAQLNFFDGHALIAGVSFSGGRASFRSRFVRTPLYEGETTNGAMQKRRVFTNLPARWKNLFALDLGNNAMHDVFAWGGKIVAAYDPGHFVLDASTLETLGPETWSGAVPKNHEMAPMPARDPHSGNLVAWIKKKGGPAPDALKFVELDASFRITKETASFPLSTAPAFVHDHRATASYYVATEGALRLSAGRAIWGASTIYECFQTPRGGTGTILLVPRGPGDRLIRVPLPAPYEMAFHIINAFDQGEHVVVDTIVYGGRVRFDAAVPAAGRAALPPGPSALPEPMRFVIDPERAVILEARKLSQLGGDAPEIADSKMGQPYRFAYWPVAGSAKGAPDPGAYFYASHLCKVDVEAGITSAWASGGIVSPAAFVTRPGATDEDDGWLLAYVGQDGDTLVAILDAQDLTKGPVATLRLGIALPGVSHTRWAAGVELTTTG